MLNDQVCLDCGCVTQAIIGRNTRPSGHTFISRPKQEIIFLLCGPTVISSWIAAADFIRNWHPDIHCQLPGGCVILNFNLLIDEDRFPIFLFDYSRPGCSSIDIYNGMGSPYIGLGKKSEVSSWDIEIYLGN